VKDRKVGEGAYAVVYQVAIKKIKVGQFKEYLLDVFSSKTNLNLVLEFLDSDLEMIIKDRSLVFLPDIKSWMAMTFRGLEFCHRNFILHRSQTNNLLIASNGELKIADFGLARDFADPGHKMTCQVITRWYRPPELLFGSRYYSSAVDIWSGHTKLPDYVPVGQFPKPPLRDLFTAASVDTNLLSKCLIYEPRKRITTKEALHHPYFFALPNPTFPSKLPKCSTQLFARPLEEVDGNVELNPTGPGVKARNVNLKRKLTSPESGESKGRSIARRLDFSRHTPGS
ncbi:kinase-like domain-containing protein, partial [Gymnopilus junonius]